MKHFIIIFCSALSVFAQAQPSQFCKEALWYKKYKAGESITINCDTVYLLNRYTFQFYQKLYKSYRSDDQRVKALTASYSDMADLYENRIAQQNEDYNKLRESFDGLSESSRQLLQKSDQRLTFIQTSLATADKNIQDTQQNLVLIEQNLKNEIRHSRKARLRNAATGFAVGAIATALVFVTVE
jgi:hypothetical protein